MNSKIRIGILFAYSSLLTAGIWNLSSSEYVETTGYVCTYSFNNTKVVATIISELPCQKFIYE